MLTTTGRGDLLLRRLGVDAIGLYQFHRPDPRGRYEDSIGAIRDLLAAGKIQMAGISNAAPEQVRTAQQILGDRLSSVQNQFSPAFRSSEPELRLCADLGTTYQSFAEVARELDATPHQVTLAWMLAKSPMVIPIPGSSRPETIRAFAAAVDLQLTPDQISRLDSPEPWSAR